MAVTDQNGYCPKSLFNPIYEQVRTSGLYYQIKESPGSTFIKISTNKNIYFRQGEKFRFRTTRTLNGAATFNWRKSETCHETTFSQNSSKKFPDFSFFKNTPATAPRLSSTLLRPTTSTPLAPSLPTSHSPTQCPKKLP